MGLSAAPHLPDETGCAYGHGACGAVTVSETGSDMAEEENKLDEQKKLEDSAAKGRDEVALELMKFIAVTTGYGKGVTSSAGFSGKPAKTPEDYADSLIQLFEKCRTVVAKPVSQ